MIFFMYTILINFHESLPWIRPSLSPQHPPWPAMVTPQLHRHGRKDKSSGCLFPFCLMCQYLNCFGSHPRKYYVISEFFSFSLLPKLIDPTEKNLTNWKGKTHHPQNNLSSYTAAGEKFKVLSPDPIQRKLKCLSFFFKSRMAVQWWPQYPVSTCSVECSCTNKGFSLPVKSQPWKSKYRTDSRRHSLGKSEGKWGSWDLGTPQVACIAALGRTG